MKIGVYGLGYVGAVTIACMAELGHDVIGVDVNVDKVSAVLGGRAPVIEPGLDELLARHVERGRITAALDGEAVAGDIDLAIIAVGTPSTASGGIDPKYLVNVAEQIGNGLRRNPREFVTVVSRSTSLPAVHAQIADVIEATSGRRLGADLGYACHPEFLRETTAIADFFEPPVVVFGADDPATVARCRELYPDAFDAPTVEVGVGEAAMVKYAANCFHAAKVTFANEIGELCRRHSINARQVMDVFCLDDKLNISVRYLRPGNPFGGSCLPKDLRAVLDAAREDAIVLPMLQGVLLSNVHQIDSIADRVLSERPRKVALVGLAFKEGTDDLREAPMVPIAERLLGKGVTVAIYDRELAVDQLSGANAAYALSSLPHLSSLVSDDLADVVDGADVVVVNHRLHDGFEWEAHVDPSVRILDLVGVPNLEGHDGYEGLFWHNDRSPAAIEL